MINDFLKKFFIFICLIAITGGIIYRVYALDYFGIALAILLSLIFFYLLYRGQTKNKIQTENKPIKFFDQVLVLVYVSVWLFSFYILLTSQSDKALITPWQVVPKYFFILYFFSTLILFYTIIRQFRFSQFLTTLHYALSFSVAIIIYKIGYGFDPFIHQATLELIDKTGAVDPKPFYYLGQYSIVLFFHKIFFIPIKLLDKILVPFIASIFLPLFLDRLYKKWNSNFAYTLGVTLLVLPFSFLILTTPQNLSFLFLLITIIYGLTFNNALQLKELFIIAVASFLIHPLAGIPAIFFCLVLFIFFNNYRFPRLLTCLLLLAQSAILPYLFLIVEKSNSSDVQTTIDFNSILSLPQLMMPGKENFILNFVYLYGFNLKIIFGILVFIGLLLTIRNKVDDKISLLPLFSSLSLLVAYLLTKFLPFKFLIAYERNDYANRILLCAALFLTPYILFLFKKFLEKLSTEKTFVKITFVIFISILITTSLYLSCPRFDKYFNSKGYSVGKNDIAAVNDINKNSNKPYIVLANQQVSVAALYLFGFNHYYKDNIFYYPIPTGGPLYQYYLDMVYKKPDRETMAKAMDLAGVDEGYFVLNKYWYAFNKILDIAKIESDSWTNIAEGDVYIFKYSK